ncbi:hypothetical protein EXIGLDRAFT_830262, partial [Exidia glandulosa HHB12029]
MDDDVEPPPAYFPRTTPLDMPVPPTVDYLQDAPEGFSWESSGSRDRPLPLQEAARDRSVSRLSSLQLDSSDSSHLRRLRDPSSSRPVIDQEILVPADRGGSTSTRERSVQTPRPVLVLSSEMDVAPQVHLTFDNAPRRQEEEPPVSIYSTPRETGTSILTVLDERAPIWRAYCNEMVEYDRNEVLANLRMSLDTLLLSALVSSVLVGALLGASLSRTRGQSDDVIVAIYALTRAVDNALVNAAGETWAALNPASPPRFVRTVNALWLTSLFTSLAVAFAAILAKHWLAVYNKRVLAVPLASVTWVRVRLFLSRGLSSWHVTALIRLLLPLTLQLSIACFLAGLAILTWNLDEAIASLITAMAALLASLYVVCATLPIWKPNCPTFTPITKQLRVFLPSLQTGATHVAVRASRLTRRTPDSDSEVLPTASDPNAPSVRIQAMQRRRQEFANSLDWSNVSAPDRDAMTQSALEQLLISGSDKAMASAYQALALLPPRSQSSRKSLAGAPAGMTALGNLDHSDPAGSLLAVDVIHAIRSDLRLRHGSWNDPDLGLNISGPMLTALRRYNSSEAELLLAGIEATNISPYDALAWFAAPGHGSLATTAILLLRLDGKLSPLWLLALLLLVDVDALDEYDYRRIQTFSADPDNSVRASGAACVAPTVAHIALSNLSPPLDHQLAATVVARMIAQTVKRVGDWASHSVSKTLLEFMAHSAWNFNIYPEVEQYMLDAPVLWRHGGTEYRDALASVLGFSVVATPDIIDKVTGRISRTLSSLIAEEGETISGWFIEPGVWVEIMHTLVHVFCGPIPAAYASPQVLHLAATIAAGLGMLHRVTVNVVALTGDFISRVNELLPFVAKNDWQSEPGVHLAQHYRELVDAASLTPNTPIPKSFQEAVCSAPSCLKCPVWPRR